MLKNLLVVTILLLLSAACAVRRPLFSPHRSNIPEHTQATTIEQCLACHADNMPHSKDRGDCLKCHRILIGG